MPEEGDRVPGCTSPVRDPGWLPALLARAVRCAFTIAFAFAVVLFFE